MNDALVREIADAVMYEGYMLYPYRPSAVKNRQRWTLGGLYPPPIALRNGGSSFFHSQMLVEAGQLPEIEVVVRFLHLRKREDGLEEGVPREVRAGNFDFPGDAHQSPIEGSVQLSIDPLPDGLYRIMVRVTNLTESNDAITTFASAHAIVRAAAGSFVSLTDPTEQHRKAASQCENLGVWPVLVGDPGSCDAMLVSPIILEDHPQIAPQSAGDLFDAAEIDEILSLRILTLTDGEKEEIRAGDPRTRQILERTESLSQEQMMQLHGVLRNPRAGRTSKGSLRPGDKVKLRPRGNADIMDLALAGQIAQIDSIEVDYEQRVHVAVIVDNDPGKDLGALRQPGHRFFFSPDEVELLGEPAR